jgi:hypothetical protein
MTLMIYTYALCRVIFQYPSIPVPDMPPGLIFKASPASSSADLVGFPADDCNVLYPISSQGCYSSQSKCSGNEILAGGSLVVTLTQLPWLICEKEKKNLIPKRQMRPHPKISLKCYAIGYQKSVKGISDQREPV